MFAKLNHNHFILITCAFLAGLIYALSGSTDGLQVADILILDVSRTGLLLAVFFGLLHFLRGTAYDVLKEVFDEANQAAATLLAGIIIALALAFG